MRRSSFTVPGAIYVLLGTPALLALVTGRLHRGGDAWFAVSILAVPAGVVFLVAARRPGAVGRMGDYAVKLATFALVQAFFAVLFRLTVSAGSDRFLTAYAFLAMFASFLSLVAAVLAIAGMVRAPSSDSPSRSRTP